MKIKKLKFINLIFSLAFIFIFSFEVFAQEPKKRVVDNAGLLSASEIEKLSSKLDHISEDRQCDIVVLTEKSIANKSAMQYADDYFDYNGYGIGKDSSGILLLVSMENRDWHISTSGYGITAFTDAGIEYISKKFLPSLKSGNYTESFEMFADLCDNFLLQASTDKPYDRGNLPKDPLSKMWISGSILIGLFVAFVVTSRMKKQLKTVNSEYKADDYVREGSLNVKNSRDMFLYSNVTRHRREKSTSGSSTHIGSSGRSHGGGGGKF